MNKKKYNLVIFDLDGTLADTSMGIITSYKHTLVQMGRPEPTIEELRSCIGGSLLKMFVEKFHFSEEDAKKCVSIYRQKYAEQGIYEVELYKGMKQTLQALKQKGYKLAVATLKAEKLAKPLLKDLGVAEYFDLIHGVDDQDKLTKTDLINMCIEELAETTDTSVLVGDSINDLKGAELSNIDFIPATYGFGFKKNDDFVSHHVSNTIDNPLELLELL